MKLVYSLPTGEYRGVLQYIGLDAFRKQSLGVEEQYL